MTANEEREQRRLEALKNVSDELDKSDMADFSPGSISYHQALHASWMCLDMVDRHLLENEAVLIDPELYALADRAHDALFDLYQRFGAKLPSVSRVPDGE